MRHRLKSLVVDLAWSPPGADVGGEGISMFGAEGCDQRFVEEPPTFTPSVRHAMGGASTRDHLISLLQKERPVGYNVQHDAVSVFRDDDPAGLTAFLDCFQVDRHVVAQRMRHALGQYLGDRAGELEKEGDPDPVLRALRESLLIAELCWALGLESSGAVSSVPVVVAAVEACATIGGMLLVVSPTCDPNLDERMLHRIHHARTAWIGILLRFDEHADLVADGGGQLNRRLSELVGRSPGSERGPLSRFVHLFEEDPVPLVGPRLRTVLEPAAPTDGDDRDEHQLHDADGRGGGGSEGDARRRAVRLVEQEEEHRLLDVAARLLLPRYMVDEAVGLLQHLGAISGRGLRTGGRLPLRSRWAWPLLPVAAAGILLFAVAILMLLRGVLESFLPKALPAVAAVLERRIPGALPALGAAVAAVRGLLIALAVTWILLSLLALYRRGRSASYLLLLRIPSATAFGLAILLALSFTWIGTQWGLGRVGPSVALAAAAVYSYVEFINQGGESRGAHRSGHRGGLGRVVEMTVLAGGMAMLVATLVLEVFGRTLLTQVPNYVLLAQPMVWLETIAILASISLALGTFLQAIWDEQTITAPLSYLRLRG